MSQLSQMKKAANKGDFYTDVPLSNVAVARFQRDTNFVCAQMATKLIVTKPSGLYDKWNMADMNRDDMQARGDNARARETKFSKQQSQFSVLDDAIAIKLNDITQKAADVQVKPQVMVPRILSYKALIRLERKLAGVLVAANWYRTVAGGAADAVNSGGTTGVRKRFSDTSTDPIAALLDEVRQQGALTGFEATGLMFGRNAWHSWRNNPNVRATLTTGSTPAIRNAPAKISEAASLLELEWVGVSRAIYNSAGENLAAVNGYIIDPNSAFLFYRPTGGGAGTADAGQYNNEDPAALVRFVYAEGAGNNDGIRIRSMRDEFAGPGGSDHWELDSFNNFGVVTKEMGTLFTDIA